MIRIYIEPGNIQDLIEIKDKDKIHKIRNVLRLKKGDFLYIFDGEGKEYACEIEAAAKAGILVRKKKVSRSSSSFSRKVILGFPLVREEKVDFILQKAVELGAGGFIPFVCERSLKTRAVKQKQKRWIRIITEAARQSQRLWLPGISEVLDFKQAISGNYKIKLAAEALGEELGSVLDSKEKEIFVMVGPEGGFAPSEHRQLEENDFRFFKLSPYILRVETASIFSVGLINYIINAG